MRTVEAGEEAVHTAALIDYAAPWVLRDLAFLLLYHRFVIVL